MPVDVAVRLAVVVPVDVAVTAMHSRQRPGHVRRASDAVTKLLHTRASPPKSPNLPQWCGSGRAHGTYVAVESPVDVAVLLRVESAVDVPVVVAVDAAVRLAVVLAELVAVEVAVTGRQRPQRPGQRCRASAPTRALVQYLQPVANTRS